MPLPHTLAAKHLVGRPALDALGAIVEGTAFGTGDTFFVALVRSLVSALGAQHAFLAAVDGPGARRAHTLAMAWDGELSANFEYDIEETPCEEVLARGETVSIPTGVADRYPGHEELAQYGIRSFLGTPLWGHGGEKLGVLAVMGESPLDPSLEPRTILEIFAERAAAELERIRAEEALRTERDFSRAILETSALGIMVAGTDARIVFANEALARILGVPRGELLGADARSAALGLTGPDGAPLAPERRLEGVLRDGVPLAGVELRLRARDGVERALSASAAPLRDRAGTITGIVTSFDDVTERRALEGRLAQAQKMEAIGRLAGGVAHDFNNLLTVILSYAQLADAEAPPGSAQHELIGPIRDAAQRAAALTRQLLAFAKRQVVSPRVVDLNAVVNDVGRLLQRLLGERIVVAAKLAPDLGPVHVDPGQIEQVLVNLAVNARDAMPDGGRLSIETVDVVVGEAELFARGITPGAYVRLSVSDTGRGMDADTARRAFEPFFTTKGERGTGLGLATCLGVVQQAGGHMSVESAPGAGATFQVLLPRYAGAPRAAAAASPRIAPDRGGPATVLVVEDEEAVRTTAVRALRRAGYGVLQAGSGPEALRVAADHAGEIDLLLTDVVLPGMTGRELAHRLASARPGVRVLYVSGYAEDDALRRDAAAGAAPVRTKPYTPLDLEAWVAEALSAPAAGAAADPAGRVTSPASSPAS